MVEEQGRGAGRPALNIERIYSTTVPAEELARTLADHFRVQEFEVQVYRTSGDRTVRLWTFDSPSVVSYRNAETPSM